MDQTCLIEQSASGAEKQSTTTKEVTVPGPEPSLRLGKEDEFNGSKGFNYPSLSIKRREFRRREIERVEKYNGKNNILAINDDVQATIKSTTVTTLNDNSRIKKKKEEGKQQQFDQFQRERRE
ncbi:unnamed protein product [Wuchereria bancrofti]|uniref:Uncharacterized protein n=1 Tax=Wuchereria bancrofti TaxID=6293 RepID=A0A3P7FMU0_WUCBA|nr:unnamed protein product [Wuchereria bancrofti]